MTDDGLVGKEQDKDDVDSAESSEEEGDTMEGYFKDDAIKTGYIASDNKILFYREEPFIRFWNNFVIVLAMYNSVTIPMAIFYGDDGPGFLFTEAIALTDAVVDFIFLLDIIITFRTTYLDTDKGEEVTDTH